MDGSGRCVCIMEVTDDKKGWARMLPKNRHEEGDDDDVDDVDEGRWLMLGLLQHYVRLSLLPNRWSTTGHGPIKLIVVRSSTTPRGWSSCSALSRSHSLLPFFPFHTAHWSWLCWCGSRYLFNGSR